MLDISDWLNRNIQAIPLASNTNERGTLLIDHRHVARRLESVLLSCIHTHPVGVMTRPTIKDRATVIFASRAAIPPIAHSDTAPSLTVIDGNHDTLDLLDATGTTGTFPALLAGKDCHELVVERELLLENMETIVTEIWIHGSAVPSASTILLFSELRIWLYFAMLEGERWRKSREIAEQSLRVLGIRNDGLYWHVPVKAWRAFRTMMAPVKQRTRSLQQLDQLGYTSATPSCCMGLAIAERDSLLVALPDDPTLAQSLQEMVLANMLANMEILVKTHNLQIAAPDIVFINHPPSQNSDPRLTFIQGSMDLLLPSRNLTQMGRNFRPGSSVKTTLAALLG